MGDELLELARVVVGRLCLTRRLHGEVVMAIGCQPLVADSIHGLDVFLGGFGLRGLALRDLVPTLLGGRQFDALAVLQRRRLLLASVGDGGSLARVALLLGALLGQLLRR